jgi:protein-tyrosine-phosphatase
VTRAVSDEIPFCSVLANNRLETMVGDGGDIAVDSAGVSVTYNSHAISVK